MLVSKDVDRLAVLVATLTTRLRAMTKRAEQAEQQAARYRAVLDKVASHLPPVQVITEWDATTPLCCYCWNVVEKYGHEPDCAVGLALAAPEA